MKELFIDQDGQAYGIKEIRNVLLEIGADDCDILFVHSDVMFGKPGRDFKRKQYLATIDDILLSLGVKHIIVPAFTYSFCNHEDYDVRLSKTSMGAYNEYVRKKEKRYRTLDPILSLSVPEGLTSYFEQYNGEHSLGIGGGLDAVHHLDGVKFLFLGADMAECFTYVHYVEKILAVPYRFDMEFSGNIIDADGNALYRRQYIHTQCYGVKLPERYGYFEDEMVDKGYVRKKRLGDKYVACFDEKTAYEQIRTKIINNVNYFLDKPYTEKDLIHKYIYNYKEKRITHC